MATRTTQPAAGDRPAGQGKATLRAWPLLVALCTASGLLIVILGTKLTFFNDDWAFILLRPGFTAPSLLNPHNGHLSVLVVLLYKGLIGTFGLGSQLPFRLVLALTVAALGALVYLYVGSRTGRFLGVVAAAIVLFLGPAQEDLLIFASVNLVGSLAVGVAVLLVMDDDTPRRNAIATALLVCSIGLSNLGVAFVVAAGIAVLLRRRPTELWIPGLPAALFTIWWIAYGSDAPSAVSLATVRHLPRYVFDAASIGLASMTGFNRGGASAYAEGRALLIVIGVAIAAWVLLGGGRLSRRILVPLGAAITFWGMTGLNYIPERAPEASRYQIMHVTLLLLIAAEVLRPVRLPSWASAAVAIVAVLALASNIGALRGGYAFQREHAAAARAALGALELARGRARADPVLTEAVAHDPYLKWIRTDAYFRATEAHGTPPHLTAGQLMRSSAPHRQAADHVLAATYAMASSTTDRRPLQSDCRRLAADTGSGEADLRLPSRGAFLEVVGSATVAIGVRRLAPPGRPVYIAFLQPGSSVRITPPPDAIPRPWYVTAKGPAAVRVCP